MNGPPGPAEVLEDLLGQPWEVGGDEGEFSVYYEDSSGEDSSGEDSSGEGPDGAVEGRFLERFDRVVEAVAGRWGPPSFRGRAGGEAVFPAWAQDTDLALAYWERGDRLAYVRLEHAFESLPYALVLGVLEG